MRWLVLTIVSVVLLAAVASYALAAYLSPTSRFYTYDHATGHAQMRWQDGEYTHRLEHPSWLHQLARMVATPAVEMRAVLRPRAAVPPSEAGNVAAFSAAVLANPPAEWTAAYVSEGLDPTIWYMNHGSMVHPAKPSEFIVPPEGGR